jgi:hypothetical protein
MNRLNQIKQFICDLLKVLELRPTIHDEWWDDGEEDPESREYIKK